MTGGSRNRCIERGLRAAGRVPNRRRLHDAGGSVTAPELGRKPDVRAQTTGLHSIRSKGRNDSTDVQEELSVRGGAAGVLDMGNPNPEEVES
jgi:hypothetical protein